MGKIKIGLKNISIRKSFMLYMLFFMLLATVIRGVTLRVIDSAIEKIQSSYFTGQSERYYLTTEDGKRLGEGTQIIEKYIEPNYSVKDKQKLLALNGLQIMINPLSYLLCIGAAAMLFYHNKLRAPLQLLSKASEKIATDDLDFSVEYNSKDEMGRLCISFEKMRRALEKNNQEMWRSMEERKRLNAAFAHDLRTPLTVLSGYSEFLLKHLEEDKLPKEKVVSTIQIMNSQIGHLKSYVQNINAIQKLEEIQPHVAEIMVSDIVQAFREIADIVCANKKVTFVPLKEKREMIQVDIDLVLQVFENLMTNTTRYAQNKIDIEISVDDEVLKIIVSDDGPGFSAEAIKKGMDAFYRLDGKKDKVHFGLGLYISKIICEKHGGKLFLSNGSNRGAVVSATFQNNK